MIFTEVPARDRGSGHRGSRSRTGCEIGAEDGHDLIGRGVVSGVTGRVSDGNVSHVGRLAVYVVRRTRIDGGNRARTSGRLAQRSRRSATDHLGSAQYEIVHGVDELHGPAGHSAAGQHNTQVRGDGHLREPDYVGQRRRHRGCAFAIACGTATSEQGQLISPANEAAT